MTEEDKKAIEYFTKRIDICNENANICDENDFDEEATQLREEKRQTEIILNLIKSQQKEIEILKSKRVNMFEQLDCIDKKNKIINEMARFIEKRLDECPYDFWIEAEKELNCKNCEEDYAKCWKQYFEKKVEESNVK